MDFWPLRKIFAQTRKLSYRILVRTYLTYFSLHKKKFRVFFCCLSVSPEYFGLGAFESSQRYERPHQSLFNISDRFCFTTSPPCGYIHKNNQKYIQKSTRLINKAITNLNWKWSIWRQLMLDIFCLPLISRPGIYFPSITIKPSFCLQPQMIKAGPGWKCIFNRLIKWHISIQSIQ